MDLQELLIHVTCVTWFSQDQIISQDIGIVRRSISLSVHSVCLLCLFLSLTACLFVCLSACMSVGHYVCLYLLSVCNFINLHRFLLISLERGWVFKWIYILILLKTNISLSKESLLFICLFSSPFSPNGDGQKIKYIFLSLY